MNPNLQKIADFLLQNDHLSDEQKVSLSKAVKDTERELGIIAFKLDRTEKVKRTTAILLEETIEELDKKREAVEAQNRELEIEFSLERVRTVAMGMRKPGDLLSICEILFAELHNMGFGELRNAMINVHNDENGSFLNYDFSESAGATVTTILYNSHPATENLVKQVRSATDAFAEFVIRGDELDQWREYRKSMGEQDDLKLHNIGQLTYYFFSIGTGAIGISTYEPISEEKQNVLKRFRNVFELAYRRFLDVTLAEAQAKEARVELALERVRARTMAMQKSDELTQASNLLFQQMEALEIPAWSAGYCIWDDDDKQSATFWMSSKGILQPPFSVPLTDNSMFIHCREAYLLGEEYYAEEFGGEELVKHYQYMGTIPDIINMLDMAIKAGIQIPVFPEFQVNHVVYFSKGFLLFVMLQPVPEVQDIFRRFGKVFDHTYTRFLDIQKAEAQAREAQIEAALEKVRGRAMAMHNSNDVSVTASLVFTELRKLGINPVRCGVGLLVNGNPKAQLYSATSSADGDSLSLVGWVELSGHPVLQGIYDGWLKQEDYFPELTGEQLKLYYEKLLSGLSLPSVPDWTKGEKQYGHFLTFSVASLYAWSNSPYDESEIKILKRFASVIDLTFRRYIELQKSEAQAREAIKASSLDRVRAEIASMRTTDDLERITPLIWNELTTLGVTFTRCGVFIMDQRLEQIHTFLSTPDGKAIAAFHLPYNTAQTTFQNLVEYWQKKQIYKEHWDEAAFINWTKNLVKSGAIAPTEKYVTGHYPTKLDLHFLPFLQGMLYVGNEAPLNEDELRLVQNLADAFSTAYARYEDFNKLETAKAQIEKTLVDLKQAQAQLVQAEKMASLGELTAGIAHEIQNPLNFVNNFSEISNELIDEMKEELAAGNLELATEIADDVKQNLEKITHHGKRADAIVKGMLQHSRSNSGIKEPTDINALADEYLRLAYHGLRAKDKSFNATLKTDFDESIVKINIVPQDIGRVILNLITNAFYACTERSRSAANEKMKTSDSEGFENNQGLSLYEPTVSVSTKKEGDQVLISVRDNGKGIPKQVVDKIFQPFFTTKPTGQGTGLGLSMSYDIVKAHGGELNVETKEGEGSKFVIYLSVKI